jgi:hypothetical protein
LLNHERSSISTRSSNIGESLYESSGSDTVRIFPRSRVRIRCFGGSIKLLESTLPRQNPVDRFPSLEEFGRVDDGMSGAIINGNTA